MIINPDFIEWVNIAGYFTTWELLYRDFINSLTGLFSWKTWKDLIGTFMNIVVIGLRCIAVFNYNNYPATIITLIEM